MCLYAHTQSVMVWGSLAAPSLATHDSRCRTEPNRSGDRKVSVVSSRHNHSPLGVTVDGYRVWLPVHGHPRIGGYTILDELGTGQRTCGVNDGCSAGQLGSHDPASRRLAADLKVNPSLCAGDGVAADELTFHFHCQDVVRNRDFRPRAGADGR